MTSTFRIAPAGLLAGTLIAVVCLTGCSTSGGMDLASSLDLPGSVNAAPYSLAASPTPADDANALSAPASFAASEETASVDLASPEEKAAVKGAAVIAYAGGTPSGARAAVEIRNPRADAAHIDRLIAKYAALYEVPEGLVRRVVKRESTFNPNAYNRGHWGLMQIKHATARGMGYRGPAKGLLDPETNLKYSVKYLRGAYMVARGNERHADRLYQRGYYYDAKRAGLLDETGLGRDRKRRRGT